MCVAEKEATMGRFHIIILIVIALLVGVFAVNMVSTGGFGMAPQGELRRVYYSNGGGMLGGFDSRELMIHNDGTGTLTTQSASWHGARTHICVYDVDAALVTRMRELINEYELWEAEKRPDSEFFAYDADTWRITLGFDGNTFSFNQNQELTAKDSEGVSAMLSLMGEMAAGEPVSDTLSPREVIMTLDGYTYTFLVEDSAAADNLCDMLPFDLEGRVVGSELVFELPGELDVSDCDEPETGGMGDLLYREDTGELMVALEEYEGEPGLYKLGEMEWPSVDRLLEADGETCSFYTYDYDEMF